MTLIPSLAETLNLPIDGALVVEKIERAIRDKLLYGEVSGTTFKIFPLYTRSTRTYPLLVGKVHASPGGSLILIRYQLTLKVRISLLLWCLVVLGGSLGAAVGASNALYTGVGIFMIIVMRWIVHGNLKRQKEVVRESLMRTLS